MLFWPETSAPPGNRMVSKPPASDRPTTAQLKADIDSGSTGDKVRASDPGLAPLGTDDEAAGNPPEAARIILAREAETNLSRSQAANAVTGHGARGSRAVPLYVGGILAIGATMGLVLWNFL